MIAFFRQPVKAKPPAAVADWRKIRGVTASGSENFRGLFLKICGFTNRTFLDESILCRGKGSLQRRFGHYRGRVLLSAQDAAVKGGRAMAASGLTLTEKESCAEERRQRQKRTGLAGLPLK